MHQDDRPSGINVSRVLACTEFRWDGIAPQSYKQKTQSWKGVTRHWLIGNGGETVHFHVRYFEVEPGGFTTLEVHRHEHVVIPIRGAGELLLGDPAEVTAIGFGDCVYVAPSDVHQFRNPSESEPFGFLCIVNAERDAAKRYRRNVTDVGG